MWTLTCKKCQKERSYASRSNYNRANRGDQLCNGCARKGQIRSIEQRKQISVATKKAMNTDAIKEKVINGMNCPEVKRKMSMNGKAQMDNLKSNPKKFEAWVQNQTDIKKDIWENLSPGEKKKQLDNLRRGRQQLKSNWNNPTFKKKMSDQRKGDKNPFYGKKHTPTTILKLRKATTERLIKFWNSGKLMGINTKPEIKFQQMLRNNNIDFITPFVLENKIYDLFLPNQNILIEIDGCYWHSKNVPLNKMNKHQLRRWKNDRYKDSLAKKNKYKIILVWEDEIDQFNMKKELI